MVEENIEDWRKADLTLVEDLHDLADRLRDGPYVRLSTQRKALLLAARRIEELEKENEEKIWPVECGVSF